MAHLIDPITPDERALLRAAFLRLIPHSDEVARSLYGHFFDRVPEARSLFPKSLEEQGEKLVRMLATMTDLLGRRQDFEAQCRSLGERHRMYGAKPEHFRPLGESLVAALREVGVPPPTPREEDLWLRLYDCAAAFMS